jgi:hypothetical protein
MKIMFCARIKRVWDSSSLLDTRSVSTCAVLVIVKFQPIDYVLGDLGIAHVWAWWVFHARFEVLTTLLQKIRVFWDLTPYWLVNILWGEGKCVLLKTLSVAKIVQRRWWMDGLILFLGGADRRAVLVREVTICVICACVCVSGLSLSENRAQIKFPVKQSL